MKKITSFLSILIVLISFQIKAQNVTVYPSYKWGVGFNIGHLFECSDVRWEPGFGYGFTLQRFLNPDTDGFFNVSIRGRLLNGTSFGQDWIKSEGLLKNTALNGITDNKMDYSSSPGFVFSNHRTEISELSAEAVFYANKLRREKRILFYFWGGIGVTEFTTYINQLNSNALKYDYTLITADKKKDILNELDVLLDDDYETFADGVTAEANTFTTNLGIGLGYMITPSLSIALEHKISFTSTDILDGQKWTNENELTGDNDIYHYTNLGFTFYFNKTRKTPKPKPVIVEKNKKPVIIINQPKKTPYQSPDCKTEIIATVLNVDTKEQIDVFANGGKLQKSNYNFFAKNKRLTIHKEIKESTTFKITATNDYGSSSKVRVIYCKQAPQKQKPIVKIVKPYSNPYLSEECFALVKAKVENIYDKNNIKVSENGNYLLSSEFSFDVSTGELEFSKSISKISNFKILATNEMGSDFDEVSIHCRGKGKKPEINVVQPNTSIVETTDCNARISARIYNIDSKQDVSISLNGSQLNSSKFDYNSSTKNLRLNTAFSGESVFVIKASNKYGYAKARITFLCKSKNRKPFVKITKPYVNPFRTEKFEANIIADVLNVDSKNNIRVTENAVTLSQYLYDFNPERHILTLNKSIKNTSVFKITATNETGTASDDVTIIAVKKAKKMPVVTINNPSTNPYVSANCNAYITATIINVEDNNNIKVTQDNFTLLPSAYKFSPSTNLLQIQRKLSEDSEFKITATNSSGSASASVLIKCTKKIELKPTVVITKPTSTFYSSEDCKANIKATIRNVNSKSQITVTENANVISQNKYSYNLNSQVLS
ncbi:MAG: hypothetical protein U9R42_01435, partial [Bacteroidota bacterium]|nr:hypothetical protein [Bacteroidota bacterium]